jgi:propanol-preferring alcohol dehydrogenase
LDLGARGLLHAETSLYTLDDAGQAYLDLAHGTVRGRAVVVPSDSYRP